MSIDRLVHEHPLRPVTPLLGIGIFLCPLIFVWFLLRYGHSARSRLIGFGWFAACLLVFQ